jgi:hypothetical protein
MPVAALIVVGPGIEVKPVKGDPLRANGDHIQEQFGFRATFSGTRPKQM